MLSLVTVALIWLSGLGGTAITPVEALSVHPKFFTYDSNAASAGFAGHFSHCTCRVEGNGRGNDMTTCL